MKKRKIVFGAGKFGRYAIDSIGKKNILCIVDNDKEKIGKTISGLPIISIQELKCIYDSDIHEIVVAVKQYQEVFCQLESYGIKKYSLYNRNPYAYYPTNKLVVNPYKEGEEYIDYSEQSIARYIQQTDETISKFKIYAFDKLPLFNHIEIETINRCNGGCSFCPVNVKSDTRKFSQMSEQLFYKLIGELEALDYRGKIALFSNNEPFLDERIIDFHKYARNHLPHARFHLFTNGTLLTLDKFIEVIPYLDELIIDNYSQNLELIPNCRIIVNYCEKHDMLKSKVTVVLRKIDEVLSTRGGDAPNAKLVSYPNAKCVLPFKQMIVRPDGKVSLCCNDPLGKNTLANLNEETLLEAWNNDRFSLVRKRIAEGGRGNWEHCVNCDVFNMG